MTDKYEQAVVALASGEVHVDVWREVARANPPTFHIWANRYKELQTEEILSACWYDPSFRNLYQGDRTSIDKNIEKFHENFNSNDFKDHENMKPFTGRRAAEALARMKGGYGSSLSKPRIFELLENFQDLQLTHLLDSGNSYEYGNKRTYGPPEVITAYLEKVHYQNYMVNWLLTSFPQGEMKRWTPSKVQDPVMGYIFGGPNIIKKLNSHEQFRHLGYLSMLNVRDDHWTESFQTWLTRHGVFDKELMSKFRDVTLTRDLEEVSDEFFNDRRLNILDNLLEEVPNLRIRVPFVISIRFKELFLCTNEDKFTNLKKAIVDGIKAFNRP